MMYKLRKGFCLVLTLTLVLGILDSTVFAAESVPAATAAGSKTLVVYFSRTGTTKAVAKKLETITGGDLFEIRTLTPYPSAYNDVLSVAQRELSQNARPQLSTRVSNMDQYDTIIMGYPIWHGVQPMAVNTFLESYDFSGKKILPFCTSGSTSVAASVRSIAAVCQNATVGTGFRANGASDARLSQWLLENGYEASSTPAPKPAAIKLSHKTLTMTVGKSKKLTLRNLPSGSKATWKSSKKNVATVTKSGLVRAKKKGKAVITAKVNGKTYRCTVTVKRK